MPLLVAAASFATGIVIAHSWLALPLLIIAVISSTGLAVVALRTSLQVATLPVAVLWMAAGAWCWQLRPLPATQHDLLQYADGLSRTVRGRVVRVRELPARKDEADRDNDSAW